MKQILNYILTVLKGALAKTLLLLIKRGIYPECLKLERKTKSEIVTLKTQMVCPTMKK